MHWTDKSGKLPSLLTKKRKTKDRFGKNLQTTWRMKTAEVHFMSAKTEKSNQKLAKSLKPKKSLFSLLSFVLHETGKRKLIVPHTVRETLFPNTVSQKDEKLHTCTLDDTPVLHVRIKFTYWKYRMKKKLIPQYRKPQRLPLLALQLKFSNFDLKWSNC